MNAQTCRYCGKSLNGQVKFHRGGNIFCNEQEATLYDYADVYVVPPYPDVSGIKPPTQPFDKEIV